MLEYIEGIPIDKQHLKYGKVELEDDRTIDYYNIKNNETVYLVLDLEVADVMFFEIKL
uniref:Ubiquitin-like domain-containing protein n=1 Tax=Meloidogyne incognita TaxID=6306 RepID=A0A914LK33_MELIC